MRVLVTRPADQAREWVERLSAQGIRAAALPLLAIDDPVDPMPLQVAWRSLPERRWVVFVSPNAVARFFAQRPEGLMWPEGLRAGSPGPGTSAALRQAGVPAAAVVEPAAEGGRYDSEGLWAARPAGLIVPGASVLIVRGGVDAEPQGQGREWLAQTLRAAGAEVDLVAAYRRAPPRLDDAGRALLQQALASPREHLWLFSSSEAIGELEKLQANAAKAWADGAALTTHPRIADRARQIGFGTVATSAPTFEAVVAAVRAHEATR